MRRFLNAIKAYRHFVAGCVKYKFVILSVVVYSICPIALFAAFFWPTSQLAIKLCLLGLNLVCAVLVSSKRLLGPYLPVKLLEM